MRIANTISLLRPATFDVVLSCPHSRLREALMKAMPSPRRLKYARVTQLVEYCEEEEEEEDDGFYEALSAVFCSLIVIVSALTVAPFL